MTLEQKTEFEFRLGAEEHSVQLRGCSLSQAQFWSPKPWSLGCIAQVACGHPQLGTRNLEGLVRSCRPSDQGFQTSLELRFRSSSLREHYWRWLQLLFNHYTNSRKSCPHGPP